MTIVTGEGELREQEHYIARCQATWQHTTVGILGILVTKLATIATLTRLWIVVGIIVIGQDFARHVGVRWARIVTSRAGLEQRRKVVIGCRQKGIVLEDDSAFFFGKKIALDDILEFGCTDVDFFGVGEPR